MNKETYKMTIAGLERELTKYPINEKLDIAAFILFGDVEITEASAKALLAKVPEFDVIVTPEAKAIPLAYEMSRLSGKKYFVARKGVKVYMSNPIKAEVQSITTNGVQRLFMGEEDYEQIRGKRVLIVDDVISTGESLIATQKIVEVAGGIEVGACAVLAEGDAAHRDDIFFLEELPLFFK